MISSLRNFFITFVIALLVFGGLAYYFYPKLVAMLPTAEQEESDETSEGVSEASGGETSSTSGVVIDVSEPEERQKGLLGGLLIFKDDENEVLGVEYVRYDLDREKVAVCEIPVSTVLYNEVGASVPLSDLFGMVNGSKAAEMAFALTGCNTDFYIVLTPASLDNLISGMNAPYYSLKAEIDYKNPKYEDYEPPIGGAYPSDYFRHVDAGRVGLNSENLAIILEYYRLYGGQNGRETMKQMLSGLYKTLVSQLVNEQKTALSADPAKAAKIVKSAETNLNEAFFTDHGADLFRFSEFERTDIPYSSRTTIKAFKDFER